MNSPDLQKIRDELRISSLLVLAFLGAIAGTLMSIAMKLSEILELMRRIR